ncbi:hypothetical protein GUITHDRAFT_50268, partial [Guillardia theta CCMP2712]
MQEVAESLSRGGFAVCDNFIPLELVRQARREMAALVPHFEASEIWVGKDAAAGAQIQVPDVRGDRVLWMCGAHQTPSRGTWRCSTLLESSRRRGGWMQHVVERSDAMLAVYPGKDTRFQTHIDNTACDGRVLTCLCYLNTEWEEEFGGALR